MRTPYEWLRQNKSINLYMNQKSRILFGAIGPTQKRKIKEKSSLLFSPTDLQKLHYLETEILVIYFWDPTNDKKIKNFWISPERSWGLFWFGEIFDYPGSENVNHDNTFVHSLFHTYKRCGIDFLKKLNGAFVLAAWDNEEKSVLLARDQLGIESLYIHQEQNGIVFGSNPNLLIRFIDRKEINQSTFLKFLTFCYNPGEQTFFQGIKKIQPAHFLMWEDSKVTIERYWYLDFQDQFSASEKEIGVGIREHLQTAVKMRLKHPDKTGAFLSGGLDSSSIVSLLRQGNSNPISTFSFRCKSESFDESRYARIVAEEFDTKHQLIDYQPEDVLKVSEMVTLMDEPFCDVGINIATYLLAQSVNGNIVDLFTGDGGDELFAGHPVYVADRTAALFRWIPWG